MLWIMAMLAALHAAPATAQAAPAPAVHLVPAFDPKAFADPDSVHWPAYFWLWNAPLEEEVLRRQLEDMAAHGARSVAMLPMPRGFRPDSTNNAMDPDYLTPEFFARVRFAVDVAAQLGMKWWLYDEGGWPSGGALGQVVEGHPELRGIRLVIERIEASAAPFVVPDDALVLETSEGHLLTPGMTWSPPVPGAVAHLFRRARTGAPDLLDPEATARFIALTHEGYRQAAGDHFGRTILFTFTDEPGVPTLDPPKSIPWTGAFDGLALADSSAEDAKAMRPLARLFASPSLAMPAEEARARVAFFDLWTARFREAYFGAISTWCRQYGLASGGHLNGEDETLNAIRYGYGQALRQCRAMDVPGVDAIWRQLFPGRASQNHFPKVASSAAHQNGTRYAFTESFCVYGNGLTPAQMKWIVDYQYLRGINLFVGGCYPLSTRDHQMTGERPHFGTMDPLWDHLPGFHAYVARLGYALSVGAPKIAVALYYPARDMWAWGQEAKGAATSHDALAQALLARGCDFDLIDDDLLVSARIEQGALVAQAMRYTTIVCGDVQWMHPAALAALKGLAAAGGAVRCLSHAPGTEGAPGAADPAFAVFDTPEQLVATVAPTADLYPPASDIRATARTLPDGEILALFNEGATPYQGELGFARRHAQQLMLESGALRGVPQREGRLRLELAPGASVAYLLMDCEQLAQPPLRPADDGLTLDGAIQAVPKRTVAVGEHDFEWRQVGTAAAPFDKAQVWAEWLGASFSGEVDYVASVEVPEAWAGAPLEIETGPVEYAATVLVDGAPVAYLLWPPWRAELPPCTAGRHEIILRVANTLANELTSERVTALWATKSGPGWPSPYHQRAIEFERESGGGGLAGPVILRRLGPAL